MPKNLPDTSRVYGKTGRRHFTSSHFAFCRCRWQNITSGVKYSADWGCLWLIVIQPLTSEKGRSQYLALHCWSWRCSSDCFVTDLIDYMCINNRRITQTSNFQSSEAWLRFLSENDKVNSSLMRKTKDPWDSVHVYVWQISVDVQLQIQSVTWRFQST